MIKANVFEVKAKLSHYLDRAAAGERIVICRHNHPIAELHAVGADRTEPRPVGPLPGRPQFDVPASFFEPLADEIVRDWEGGLVSGGAESPPSVRRRTPKVAESKATYSPGSRRRR